MVEKTTPHDPQLNRSDPFVFAIAHRQELEVLSPASRWRIDQTASANLLERPMRELQVMIALMIQAHPNPVPIDIRPARYLGIYIRPRSFGFVVVEGKTILDSGVRACDHPDFDDCLGQRFGRILLLYKPFAVISPTGSGGSTNPRKFAITTAVKKAAKQASIPIIRISPATLRRYFLKYNAQTKHERAQAMASILPELAWHVPPKRKPWESEARRMSVFGAAAVVIAHALL